MPAMTADLIVDRVRSVCAGATFGLIEATGWDSFDLQPTTNIDGVFRVPPPNSQHTVGMYDYAEDRTESLQIWVARKHNSDYSAIRKVLLRDMHSLTAAVVRDAHQQSGDYSVSDGGRGHTILAETGKEYITLRLTLPIRYEAQL